MQEEKFAKKNCWLSLGFLDSKIRHEKNRNQSNGIRYIQAGMFNEKTAPGYIL